MVTLRPITPSQAPDLKAIRLSALRDAPSAFGSTYARESQFSEAEWSERIARWNGVRSVCYLAWDAAHPCGIAAGLGDDDRPRAAHLVSMWVAPTHRRTGVGRLLVERVIQWARDQRVEALYLSVTSTNDAATCFYERLGFAKTGAMQPYPNDPSLAEFEMVRPIEHR